MASLSYCNENLGQIPSLPSIADGSGFRGLHPFLLMPMIVQKLKLGSILL